MRALLIFFALAGELLAQPAIQLIGGGGQSQGQVAATAAVGNVVGWTAQSTSNTAISASWFSAVLVNAGGTAIRVSKVLTKTASILVNGIGGIDTGPTPTNNSWYAVYIVSDGTTDSLLLSLSFTAPTLPGGVTFQTPRPVGQVRVNGAGAIVAFLQVGNHSLTDANAATNTVASGFSNVAQQIISAPAAIPPNATFVDFQTTGSNVSGGTVTIAWAYALPAGFEAPSLGYVINGSVVAIAGLAPVSAQQFSVRTGSAQVSLTIAVVGYVVPQ